SLIGLHLDLERPRIDTVEGISLLDLAALAEQPLDDDAGNTRTNVGNADRRNSPRQFAHDRARLRLDGDDADVGRGVRRGSGGSSSGLRLIAAAKKRRQG